MPQIRHIPLATNDPDKTAAFYKEAFGFKEIARTKNVDDPGRGLDYVGLHHFGIEVADNLEEWIKKLETLGADCFMRRPESLKDVFFESKIRGPDGVVFDVSEHPWAGTEPIKDRAAASPPRAKAVVD